MEERSHAVHFLLKRGVDQFAVITEISSVDYSPSASRRPRPPSQARLFR
jgi:hypothetical protein